MASTDLVNRDIELKPFLGVLAEDEDEDKRLDLVNDIARALIEDYLGRFIVSRGAITEYHTLRRTSHEIYVTQPPIITVTSVHEDSTRTFDSTVLLVEDTDYIVSKPEGKLIRIANDVAASWLTGWRAIQVIYTGGYSATANVPMTIKHAALRTCALIWNELRREEIGYSSIADAQGNITRLVPGGLTSPVKRLLYPYRVMEMTPTGEVDA